MSLMLVRSEPATYSARRRLGQIGRLNSPSFRSRIVSGALLSRVISRTGRNRVPRLTQDTRHIVEMVRHLAWNLRFCRQAK